jgi:glycosyltransferase involved in cell wall biosynthesis
MRLAHFIQRYPPALGGSEAYFARLSRWCAAQGDDVAVFTTNAIALEAFWTARRDCVEPGIDFDAGVRVRRYPLLRWPGRRWLLKAMSLIPHRAWQCMTLPCNPIAPEMWRDAGRLAGFNAVHASAFPYAFPILCARRLARRLRVPFFLTPFLHLGDPDNPHDRTRHGYTSPALAWLLREADGVFVQTRANAMRQSHSACRQNAFICKGSASSRASAMAANREAARQHWNLPDDSVVVGHLANQSWEKGTNDLLAAIEPLWRPGRHIQLLLAGPQMPNFVRCWTRLSHVCPKWHARASGNSEC